MQKRAIVIAVVFILFIAILIMLNHESKISGFSSKDSVVTYIQLEPEYSQVKPGSSIIIGIKLVQLGDAERRDVTVNTFLKDEDNSLTSLSSQTVALETTASLTTEISFPKNIKENSYNIYVEVRDANTNQVLSTTSQRIIVFESLAIKLSENSMLYIMIIIFILTTLAVILVITLLHTLRHTHTIRGKR